MNRHTPNFDYEASPFEDDYRGFDPREDGSRGPLILALAIGVLLIFGAVVWNTYRQGVRGQSTIPPIILADNAPYKHVPGHVPAGAEPVLEKTIYRQFEDEGAGADTEPAAELLKGGVPVDLRGGLSSERPITEVAPLPAVRAATPPVKPSVVQPPQPAPVTEPTLVVSPPVPAAPWKITPSGSYLVQVGAFRSQEAASTAWTRLQGQAPNLLLGTQSSVQRADLGSKGIFFRLRASAFAARTDAIRFCDALKTRQIACIVVTR